MTQFQSPDTLRQHRPLLLALEAIGWLHMVGKAKVDFLQEHGGQVNKYDYKKRDEKEKPPFLWDDLLKWVKDNDAINTDAWPGTLTEFIRKHTEQNQGLLEIGTERERKRRQRRKHTKRNQGLLGLLQAGHGMASGIEKNLPSSTSGYLSQDITHLWLSTAFGHPARNLLSDPPELLTDAGWKQLLQQIKELLNKLKELGDSSSSDIKSWWRWREGAIGEEGWLRKAFTGTLAETRLPNNDVTLFDQSYVAAALFKSAAAGAILKGSSFLWLVVNLKQETCWRLLTIGMGTDHYESRAVRIGDWTGTKSAMNKFFKEVRKLIEVDLAVGSLLYRDGEVCVFSFPGERSNGQHGDQQISNWENWLQKQIDDCATKANFETPPYCKISEPSRSLVGMTKEIQKAREVMSVPIHRTWNKISSTSAEGHVCPVCLMRDNGDSTDKQKPCEICKNRRTHRRNDWLDGKEKSDSIWISEVADANDRVALVTMSLDIEPWLDGSRLDSLRTQAIAEWRRFNPVLDNISNPINLNIPYDSLKEYIIKSKLSTFDNKNSVLKSLQDGYQHESSWESFFSKIVEDRADAPSWNKLDENGKASWLTHQLFRKLASQVPQLACRSAYRHGSPINCSVNSPHQGVSIGFNVRQRRSSKRCYPGSANWLLKIQTAGVPGDCFSNRLVNLLETGKTGSLIMETITLNLWIYFIAKIRVVLSPSPI